MTLKQYSPSRALRRLGSRQTLRGAIILGILVGVIMGAQGAAFAAAYPTQQSRDQIVASLKSAPGLGFMTGEIADASTPASYAIYKSAAMTALITGVWGLLVTTRLLRGQEEDGQFEQIISKHETMLSASSRLIIGYSQSLLLAFIIALIIIAGLGLYPKVNLSFSGASFMTLSVFLPALFFGTLGILTSQLAQTRRRAVMYGLVPLLILFSIRGAGNSIADWNWLKNWSPFGWSDLFNPVLNPQVSWILPTVIFGVLFTFVGLYFARKRDLGDSILPQSQVARSHFYLLGSSTQLSVRQNIGTSIWWGVGTLFFSGLIAAIAKVGTNILQSSPQAASVFSKLGDTQSDLVIMFLSFGGIFTALILLVMASVYMGNIRNDEAKGYLETMLVQPLRRRIWLAERLLLTIAVALIITILAGYVTWQLTSSQGITLDFWIVTQNMIALVGTVVLTLGIGAIFYGILPRIAAYVMYAVIVWTFLEDILKALFSINDFIDKTSLFHYVSFALNKSPDWHTFSWLVVIGIILMAIGIWQFGRRDIVNE